MLGFCQSLRHKKSAGLIPVIPDIKIISPKEGNLFKDMNPIDAAILLENLGAPAISVVTEQKHFGGSTELLEDVASAVSIPVLRKDFITEEEDVYRTKDCGATAILLICGLLSEERLEKLYDVALRLSLEPLIEAHTKEELALAGSLGAELIGINNRDILNLEMDDGSVSRTQKLAAFVPKGALFVSESGIRTPEEAKAAIQAGAGAVLVGTAIWLSGDACKFYTEMCRGESEENE
jgi:indole-3-glycerol phosphate synthase